MTTTTTGDPSTLKTPATLSGGDLVSRLLAATPPYLYNVPLPPHSFFFSEMLRSFVQAKAEAGTSVPNPPSVPRRRKRSWRDARDRPLELTTKDKSHHHHLHHHHHHHHQEQQQQQQREQQQQQQHQQLKDAYFQAQQQQDCHAENRFKSHSDPTNYSNDSKNQGTTNYEQKPSAFIGQPLKPVDDNRSDFSKQSRGFFDDSSRHFSSEQSAQQEALFAAASQKVKPEEQQSSVDRKNCNYGDRNNFEERAKITSQELSFFADQKNKLDLAGRHFLPGITGARAEELEQAAKSFGLSGNVPNTDFLPAGPLWYPPYPAMAQNYPGIDPLHFFIDLRVSGHIWDRKLNERQLPFKSKHCSAFSVPQTKEYNRPLNLTRDEATTSSTSSSSRNNGSKNLRGTHFILRNLTDTYKDIREMEKTSNRAQSSSSSSKSVSSDETNQKDYQARASPKSDSSRSSTLREHQQQQQQQQQSQQQEESEGKDLRALIGLELVVDYVKEPKEDPAGDGEQSTEGGE